MAWVITTASVTDSLLKTALRRYFISPRFNEYIELELGALARFLMRVD
jgi:hypothetical protein